MQTLCSKWNAGNFFSLPSLSIALLFALLQLLYLRNKTFPVSINITLTKPRMSKDDQTVPVKQNNGVKSLEKELDSPVPI